MNLIAVAELPSEAFAPFGEVGAPLADGGHAAGDVALDLSGGTPRFYIMRLAPAMPLTPALSPRAGRGRDPRSGKVRGGKRRISADLVRKTAESDSRADYAVWPLHEPMGFAT